MNSAVIKVPDMLWKGADLSEGAKVLWCYLHGSVVCRYTFRELRSSVGISQNSLLKYLQELQTAGWLHWHKPDLHSIAFQLIGPTSDERIAIPMELLLDKRIPHGAKWLWGIVQRAGTRFDYIQLHTLSGYSQTSITEYLTRLFRYRWLVGDAQHAARWSPFHLEAVNPFQLQRDAEVADLECDLRRQDSDSIGPCLMAHMVRLLSPGTLVLRNVTATGLKRLNLSFSLSYTVYLPAHKLALEFQDPHYQTPIRYTSDEELYQNPRAQELVKLGWCQEKGIGLVLVWAHKLSLPYLRSLLEGKIPLAADLSAQQHLADRLERAAARRRWCPRPKRCCTSKQKAGASLCEVPA